MDDCLPPAKVLRDILSAGICAPSAENVHYLRFVVAGAAVRLESTDHSSWERFPHREFLALLSYGAVIENIALRSLKHGLALEWELLLEQPALVVMLRWKRSDVRPDPLDGAIESRHTNRRFYGRRRAGTRELAGLADAAAQVSGVRLVWMEEPTIRRLALSTIRLAETERFRRPALHRELFSSVRFEIGWHQSAEEWLSLGALQIELPMRLPFKLMRHWTLMRAASSFGAHYALGIRAGYLPAASAPHLGLMVSDQPEGSSGTLDAGRGFQRVWLAAQAYGLAMQPMAAATVMTRQIASDGWVRRSLQQSLQDRLLQLAQGGRPFMLFRAGYAKPASVVSTRHSIEHYLEPASAGSRSPG